jgi:hypothetical protein
MRVPRGLVQYLTKSLGATLEDTLPYDFQRRENPGEPLAVPMDTDNHEFFRLGRDAVRVPRSILNKVALVEICNLELKLNLRQVMGRHLGFNLPSQGTLNFDQNSIFSDSVR